jgi:hypothetical protein
MNDAYDYSGLLMGCADSAMFKKKKRRRKKKHGLLSRKNFIYEWGRNMWTLVEDYLSPPLKHPVVVSVKKKRKEEDVAGDYSVASVILVVINHVKLNLYCSDLLEEPVGCELDRVKELNVRPGGAKKTSLSVARMVDLFARISDAWDCFEKAICSRLRLPPDVSLVPEACQSMESPEVEAVDPLKCFLMVDVIQN